MQTKRSVKLKQAEGKNRFKETISTKSRARRKEVFNVNADYASAVYAAKHSSKKSGGKKVIAHLTIIHSWLVLSEALRDF